MSSTRSRRRRAFPVLLPDKHLRLSESVLGFAGLVLSFLGKPVTFDQLWKRVKQQQDSGLWPAAHGVENLVLALCFLFSIEAVDVSTAGELCQCA